MTRAFYIVTLLCLKYYSPTLCYLRPHPIASQPPSCTATAWWSGDWWTVPLYVHTPSARSSPRKKALSQGTEIMFKSILSPNPPRLVTQVTTTVRTKWGNFVWQQVFDSHPFRGGIIAYSCGLIVVARITYQQTTATQYRVEASTPRDSRHPWPSPHWRRSPPRPWPCTFDWAARWSWRPSPRGWGHARGGGSISILEDC